MLIVICSFRKLVLDIAVKKIYLILPKAQDNVVNQFCNKLFRWLTPKGQCGCGRV